MSFELACPAVFCPRCGAENRETSTFCVSCGAELEAPRSDRKREPRSFRVVVADLVGRTRRARLLTIGTLVALLVATVAFFALPSEEDSAPDDAYTRAAERLCIAEKQAIVAAARDAVAGDSGTLAAYAAALVPITVEWRAALGDLRAPEDRREEAEALSLALREVAVEAGALSRLAREGDSRASLAAARRVDASTAAVEEAIEDLGLERCAGLQIAFTGGS